MAVPAGTDRRHAVTSAVPGPHPTAAAKPAPAASACACVGSADLQSWDSRGVGEPSSELYSPLVLMARWKSPAAAGEAIWSQTLDPPADSPKMVTLCGSPPKAAMLRCTQRS